MYNEGMTNNYSVTVWDDNDNQVTVTTEASTEHEAIDIVLAEREAPLSAVVSVQAMP